jgi:hypothetical protein
MVRESLRKINSSAHERERQYQGNLPEHQVTRVKVHLLQRAPTVLEPLHILLLEDEEILKVLLLWRLILVGVLFPLFAEEIIEQLGKGLDDFRLGASFPTLASV